METRTHHSDEELLRQHQAHRLRVWTERLNQEYEHVLWAYRVKLRRPVVCVRPLDGKWGMWEAETRTLSLSQRLIETHAWDVVLEILKHEMAHQLVTDHFQHDDGHGPLFQEACRRLGVAEWATRASGDLPEGIRSWKEIPDAHHDERLLRRVEKLLALATSSNEHEAGLAMQKVQELYAKYNLERLEAKRSAKMVTTTIALGTRRVSRPIAMVFSLLNDYFFVRVIYTTLYEANALVENKAVELLGTRENVLMAEYVYDFLTRRLEALWQDYRRAGARGLRTRNSFLMGVLCGFREKLERQQKETLSEIPKSSTEPSHALMRLEDPELDQFVAHRFPRLVNVRRGRGYYDADSYAAGQAEGNRIVIHRAVETSDGHRGRLLR